MYKGIDPGWAKWKSQLSRGAQYVFVSNGKIYKLAEHAADLKTHAGHTVNLTGDVKGDTIKVGASDRIRLVLEWMAARR